LARSTGSFGKGFAAQAGKTVRHRNIERMEVLKNFFMKVECGLVWFGLLLIKAEVSSPYSHILISSGHRLQ
jgi:hypothetical protein